MSIGRYAWGLRTRLVGARRVITGADVAELARSPWLGWRGRLHVRALHVQELALGPPTRARIPIGRAHIELGGDTSFAIDWKTFVDVFAAEPYAADYRGAHVLDVGAHKGYFGAYALARGASVVVSFEPSTVNHRTLERTARAVSTCWLTRRAALGEEAGSGTLFLDHTSWAHSLVRVERPARRASGS